MTTLRDITAEIVDQIGALAGIRAAPDDVPDAIPAMPFLATSIPSGRISYMPAGMMTFLVTVRISLHVARNERGLERAIREADDYSINVPNAIYAALGSYSAIQTVGEIAFTQGSIGWNEQPTFGFVWDIQDVKLQVAVT